MFSFTRNIFTLIYLLVAGFTTLAAQTTTYCNEWIDYNKPHFKIKVVNQSLYRIPYSVLAANGLPTVGSQLKMYNMGQEVPLYISTSGAMGETDYVEFFGKPNDGSFDAQLYSNPAWHLNPHQNLFTDTAIYFLTTANPGELVQRYQTAVNDLSVPLPPKEEYFWHTSLVWFRNIFTGGVPFRNLGGVNNYFADFGDGEGFTSLQFNEGQTRNVKINTEHAYTENPSLMARVETKVNGQSNNLTNIPDHHLLIDVNGTLYVDTVYEGYANFIYRPNVPVLQLTSPLTDINYTNVADLGGVDKASVVYAAITYPRQFNFSNARKFLFTIPNNSNKYLEITNFNGGAAPILYDLTNKLRFVPVVEAGVYKFYLPAVPGGGANRQLFLSNTSSVCDFVCTMPACNPNNCGIFTVSSLTPVNFVNYSQAANQGNYLIVSHTSLMAGDIDHVERYRLYRSSPAGGSYNAIVVNIDHLYDQFAYGVQKNPLSINNFLNYAIDQWNAPPQHLLLLGKAISYHRFGLDANRFHQCLVPTYGHQPSDLMLTRRGINGFLTQLSAGRVPAKSPNEVAAYLDKIIQYETYAPCTKEDRLWRKKAIHIAGGNNIGEANSFLAYLNKYKTIYEDTLMGGIVDFTYTRAADATTIVEFPDIDQKMNNGLALISFLGHSSGQYWNVDLEAPTSYSNTGKYPFIISSSCFVGNIHDPVTSSGVTMAEDYVLANQLGAIGFMATVSFGFPSFMDIVVDRLYRNFCYDYYNMPIGYAMKKAIETISVTHPTSDGVKMTVQEYTLAGDPAVVIHSWSKPEYIIDESDVFFEPAEITTNIDSFAVHVVVNNLGKATKDSIALQVTRTFPDGSTAIAATKRFLAPIFKDTLTLYVKTANDTTSITGNNTFTVLVDYDNKVEEDCENNNLATKSAFIFSDLLVPISPCNFSIVCNPNPTLYASTGQPLLAALPYKMEIDTTTLFNNPLSQILLNSQSGVIKWQPDIPLQHDKVYYWRASQLSPAGDAYNWQMNSFIYRADSCAPGWNQSHYYQYLQNKFFQTKINPANRHFEFTGVTNVLRAKNARDNYAAIDVTLNVSNTLLANSCLKGTCNGGISILAFKPELVLEPMTTTRQNMEANCNGVGTYGNIQCAAGVKYGFEFHTGSAQQLQNMVNFLQNVVPNGYYVLAYSVRDHRLGATDPADVMYAYQDQIYQFFADMGIPQLDTLSSNQPFIAFGKKGSGGSFTPTFATPADPTATFEVDITVEGKHQNGNVSSTTIGPALQWGNLDWKQSILDSPIGSADSISVNVYGLPTNGSQPVLLLNSSSNQTNLNLSSINAAQYPFLKLEAVAFDSVAFTMPQIDYWRVYYQLAAELALNRHEHFVFLSDTLLEGEPVHLEIAVTNASSTNMDSVLVHYNIIDNQNQSRMIPKRHQPVAAHQTQIFTFDYSTEGLGGNNTLIVELNPDNDQPEKFRFNNVLILSFFVIKDKINPVLDVTFDGRHISDGELVSAKPTITIMAKDENRYLAINDTSSFRLFLRQPDAVTGQPSAIETPLFFSNPQITFIPATAAQAATGNNAAKVEYRPTFSQSGLYELVVRAKDRSSNNFAAEKAYRTAFKVETRPMISNVFNYPNPFTSSTRFVFTLTGSEIPDFMKIQIMTVSGRVVREITRTELGQLRIGNNLTDFAWDGTDQFGNQLANGIYLYRVVTRLNGENMENFKLGSDNDALFKNGIGKMYLMR